jgi:hypothetical protein
MEKLKNAKYIKMKTWEPPASGITIPDEIALELEKD